MNPIEWWFSGSQSEKYGRWFQTNSVFRDKLDHEISKNYIHLLKESEEICIDNDYSPMTLFRHILVLDQFSRHIYRGNVNLISKNTKKAVKICKLLHQQVNLNNTSIFTCEQMAFILMPYKHDNTFKYFSFMMEILTSWNYTKNIQLTRFYKNLIRRYSKIMNNQIELSNPYQQFDSINFSNISENLTGYFYILDKTFPGESNIEQVIEQQLKEWVNRPELITVSLSGGVDSMVITYILANFQEQYNYKLQAVHINYKNRKVSDKESDFVRFYCNHLQIPLYIRVIDEIQRIGSDRKFYETHTRNIRFEIYKKIRGTIVLGHMHDDIVENILTNFSRGKDLFHLKKMNVISTQNSVTLWRPLLSVVKTEILNFAKQHHIAYLLNTTPRWSNRGKFRQEFLPAYIKQYTPQAISNIVDFSETLQECDDFLKMSLFQPFLNSVKQNLFGFHVEITPNVKNIGMKLGLHFWHSIFSDLLHPLGIKMPSHKSIHKMMEILKIDTEDCRMITLKHELYVVYEHDILYVLIKNRIIKHIHCTELDFGIKYWRMIKTYLITN